MTDEPTHEPYRLATEVARENVDTLVFRVAPAVAQDNIGRWSTPVQFSFHRHEDGTYDLNVRTVDLRSLEAQA